MAAGYIAAERRLSRWRWNEPEIPEADEVYLRSLQRTPPLRDAPDAARLTGRWRPSPRRAGGVAGWEPTASRTGPHWRPIWRR
jgi:hypothetical protein